MQHREFISTKNNLRQKIGQIDENCHLYASVSQKHSSKSKSHSLNAAHDQIISLGGE